MDCREFESWLDRGLDAGERSEASAHAAGCPACERAEAAERDLTGLLSQRFATAPAGFTERVLAQLPARRAEFVPIAVPDPYPWFLRMLLEPSTVLAISLGGIYAIWAGNLWGTVRAGAADLTSRWVSALTIFPHEVALAFAWLSAAALLFGGSYLLYRLANGLGARLFRIQLH